MATTSIEWSTHVWNPTAGCDRVSPGCDHCYAMTTAKRLKGMGQAEYQHDGDPRTSGPGFLAHESPSDLDWPLRKRKPMRVFVNSMSDLFHANITDEFIVDVWARMVAAPQHTFQVLTKRPARMRSLLSRSDFRVEVAKSAGRACENGDEVHDSVLFGEWPRRNVWLGVSVENQQWADIRIPALLDTPAAVRFLSCEPLLGPLDLRGRFAFPRDGAPRIGWCIVGGESGPGARPMHPDWARSLRDQCVAAGVPLMFKQWGEYGLGASVQPGERRAIVDPDGISYEIDRGRRVRSIEIFGAALMRRVGKKAAGRELDGRTWDEYPAGAA